MYIVVMLVVIGVMFIVVKRPIYEALFVSYFVMILITGHWDKFFTHMYTTTTNTLFYAIVAFLAIAQLFGGTKVIDTIIAIILFAFGRLRGGAGYVSLMGSTFMASLSGSGAGNVAATGVFTIPAMKKSGFPAHLAANIESATSTLGNQVPPSGIIFLSFGALDTLYKGQYSMSTFWILTWGIGLWFFLQRAVTIYAFCRYYKVKPMSKEDIPDLRASLKKGWPGLLLPLVILVPFLLDNTVKPFFTSIIGPGANSISSCVLLFTPGLAALYTVLIARKLVDVSPKAIAGMFGKQMKSIVPVTITIFFAYSISNLFLTLGVGEVVGTMITSLGLNYVALAFVIPLFTAVLGMVLPGSSLVAIFGTTIITIMAAAGGNPLLIAAMIPVVTGAMEGMTPPVALCMYTAMGIAKSGLKETTLNCLIWVGLHYLLAVVVLLGLLPLIGLK